MTSASTLARKRRGAATQADLARYLQAHGFPFATDAGAGRQGNDILGAPGLNIECKARSAFDPLAWLRQAHTQGDGLAVVVWRPNGYGPKTIEDWPAMLRLGPLIATLRDAGYGDPNPG